MIRFSGHFCLEELPSSLGQFGKTKMEVSEANFYLFSFDEPLLWIICDHPALFAWLVEFLMGKWRKPV
jgi:hypothetical protein